MSTIKQGKGKIKIKQKTSVIDRPLKQKLIIKALGLGKINRVKQHNDTPQIRGMIAKVKHIVEVIE
jgi:large subunit ribosomal protein L30